MNKKWDSIWINALIAKCESGYDLIDHAAIAVKDGKIAWIGSYNDLQETPDKSAHIVYDVQKKCLTPGLIDCHTHLVYAGNRAHEFEMRLKGATYEEIAQLGGGIQSTVKATREASEEALFQQSLQRARVLLSHGVTTLEIKSGYGLNWETEFKMLRVAKHIAMTLPLTVKKTFLGAHTVPVEYRDHPQRYVDLLCHEMIPIIARDQLADAVDVFCETIAFNLQQTEMIFKTAKQYGLEIKCHAEQLSDSKSAALAASYHALSADHLEYASEESIKAMAESKTTAVLLPGAFYFLREKTLPPIKWLKQYNVPIALASDCNPGTSPVLSLLLIVNMACTLFRLTPEDALLGITKHAACALGIHDTHGTLTVGKMADFAIWDINHPLELAYYLGNNPLKMLVKEGKVVKEIHLAIDHDKNE